MKFDKPKGQRLHRYFYSITTHDGMWWVPSVNKWMRDYREISDYDIASTHCHCKTLRAFRRHLRKHPELKGKAVFVNRYQGYDVYA